MEALSGIKAALDIVGRLRELNKKIGDSEFKNLLVDLNDELADARLEAANLKSELAEHKEQINELRSKLQNKTSSKPLLNSDDVYEFDKDGGVFCTHCFDTTNDKIRVKNLSGDFSAFGKYECPKCKNTFGDASRKNTVGLI